MRLKKPMEIMVEHYYRDNKLEEMGIETEEEVILLPVTFYEIDMVNIIYDPEAKEQQGAISLSGGMYVTDMSYKDLNKYILDYI